VFLFQMFRVFSKIFMVSAQQVESGKLTLMKHVHGHRKALGIDEMGRSESGSRDSFGTFSGTAIRGGERRKTPPQSNQVS
jgi:hypothetical protein